MLTGMSSHSVRVARAVSNARKFASVLLESKQANASPAAPAAPLAAPSVVQAQRVDQRKLYRWAARRRERRHEAPWGAQHERGCKAEQEPKTSVS